MVEPYHRSRCVRSHLGRVQETFFPPEHREKCPFYGKRKTNPIYSLNAIKNKSVDLRAVWGEILTSLRESRRIVLALRQCLLNVLSLTASNADF